MVQHILNLNRGEWYSITMLQSEVAKRFFKTLKRETISNALREIDYTTGQLEEREQIQGSRRIPVKYYSIIKS